MKKLIALLLAVSMLAVFAGCEPKEPQEPQTTTATLGQALQNTRDAIVKNKTFTVSMNGYMAQLEELESDLYAGPADTFSGEVKLSVDAANKKLSAYGQTIADGQMYSMAVHDGWSVFYESNDEEFYKENITEDIEQLFSDQPTDLAELLELDEMDEEEQLDLEKFNKLWETFVSEKLTNEDWLKEYCGYTTVTGEENVIHRFDADLAKLLEELAAHFKDVFVDEDAYEDFLDDLEDFDDATLLLSLIQKDNMINALELDLDLSDNSLAMKLHLNMTLDQIGTTELDTEMLDKMLKKVDEYVEREEPASYIGTIDGQNYSNEAIGIRAEFGKEWAVATHEEAAEITGMIYEGAGLEEMMEEYGTFCDLFAVYSDGRSTINIMIQDNNFMVRNKTDKELLESSQQGLQSTLEASGVTNIKTELSTMTFAGQERDVLKISGSVYGSSVYETMIVLRTDDYLYMITASSYNNDNTEQFLSVFTQQ